MCNNSLYPRINIIRDLVRKAAAKDYKLAAYWSLLLQLCSVFIQKIKIFSVVGLIKILEMPGDR